MNKIDKDDEEEDEDGNPINSGNPNFTPSKINNNPARPVNHGGPVTPLKLKIGGGASNQQPTSGIVLPTTQIAVRYFAKIPYHCRSVVRRPAGIHAATTEDA